MDKKADTSSILMWIVSTCRPVQKDKTNRWRAEQVVSQDDGL
jgi:hypothetical protein